MLTVAVPPAPAAAGTVAVGAGSGAGYAAGSLVVAICVGVFAAASLVIAVIGLARNRAADLKAEYERGKADTKASLQPWIDYWKGAYEDQRRDPRAVPLPPPPPPGEN